MKSRRDEPHCHYHSLAVLHRGARVTVRRVYVPREACYFVLRTPQVMAVIYGARQETHAGCKCAVGE